VIRGQIFDAAHAATGPHTGRIRPQAKLIHRGEVLEETAKSQNVTVT
jgi:hypothetical protein